MKNLRLEVIKYAKMLNSKKLSALRSGNISIRHKAGFLITPSGTKYNLLKKKDIIFVSLKGLFDKKKGIPSSEWRFHQDLYLNKKKPEQLFMPTLIVRQQSQLMVNLSQPFTTWLLWQEVMILNVQNMLLTVQENYQKISLRL